MKKYFIWLGILIIAMSSCQKETEQEIHEITNEQEQEEAQEEIVLVNIDSLSCPKCIKDLIRTVNINPGCVTGSRLEEYEYEDELFYKIIIDETLCTLNDQTLGNKFLYEDCTSVPTPLCGNESFFCDFYNNIEFKQIIWEKN